MTRKEFIDKWGYKIPNDPVTGDYRKAISADLDSLFPSSEGAELDHSPDHPGGAEEILEKYVRMLDDDTQLPFHYVRPSCALKAMQEFATLHAQRLAEKMAEEKCKKCKYRGLPDSISEALNSGDGVYRP